MTHTARLMGRRELLGFLAAGLLTPRRLAAQAQEPQFAALDHIEFYVSNIEKSRDFYVRIFGNTLKNRGAKRYLKLGSTYMAFEPPRGNAAEVRVDHFSVAIKQLDMAKLHTFLERRGVTYQDYPSGRDTGITDGDSIRLQLSPEDGWSLLNPPNFPLETVSIQGEPIFRPIALDHVLLNVTNPEKSVAHYQKFLGPPAQRDNDGVWFQVGKSRIGLIQTPAGQRTGVHDFGVSAAAFNHDAVVARLQQAGARVQTPAVADTVEFRDPDGLLIQVAGPRA